MVSRVLYRPFDTEDFDAIALILQQLWHNNSDNDKYNRLEAACDLAYCLSSSTFSQVAVIDGEAVFSTEIRWDPVKQSDPNYHYSRIAEGFKLARGAFNPRAFFTHQIQGRSHRQTTGEIR